ncbi:heterokaryon incompatibility protein-domain-containing protein [Xylogone sp. PMI_703]|nr:heterokaryon incompatibility protein-domain-containing protein [Xylogone sp. PMI_703]
MYFSRSSRLFLSGGKGPVNAADEAKVFLKAQDQQTEISASVPPAIRKFEKVIMSDCGSVDIAARMAALSLPGEEPIEMSYEYLPLPSNKHIRIVHILPRPKVKYPSPFWMDTEPIHCIIKTVNLDEEPEFDALSYTWGNPITVYEDEEKAKDGAKTFEQLREIVCNGKLLKITTNLHDALLAMRQGPSDSSFEEIVNRPRGEYIWIDSICINQSDIAERNAQVAIMSHIYSTAQITIVWLGRDDSFTRPGVEVLREISQIRSPGEAIHLMKQQSQVRLYFRELKSHGLRQFKEDEWLSVYAFLSRNWFRRAWIIQELALARRICIMSGLLIIDWPMVSLSCRILQRSTWFTNIAAYADSHMEGRFGSVFVDIETREVLGPGPKTKPCMYEIDRVMNLRFNPARSIMGMSEIRSGLIIAKSGTVTPYQKPLDFTDLMQFFRCSSATEPRDKVYALCGLLPKEDPGAEQNSFRIIPDYNKPVEVVFMEAAWFQLQSAKNLNFLGHVQDLAQTGVKNLPSWVPDLTVMPLANQLSVAFVNRTNDNPAGESPFFAAANLDFATPLFSQPPVALSLQGIVYDIVVDEAEFRNSDDLMGIMNLLSDLPHIHWDDVLGHARKLSDAESEDNNIPVSIAEGYLISVNSSQEPDKAGPNSETGSSSVAETTIPVGSRPRIQTFLEVLWRTLIADNWEGEHPAPLEAGYAFVDSLIDNIRMDFFKAGKDQSPAKQSEKLRCLKTLATSEFEGFTKYGWNVLLNKVVYKSTIDPKLACIPVEDREHILARFMPKMDDPMDLIWQNETDLQESRKGLWFVRSSQIMRGRKLFRTRQNRALGAGSKSLKIGDFVCLLAGGSVPYVIRRVDGAKNKFRFVGEAYVHGIMHGEAVKYKGAKVLDIILV